MYLIIRKLMLFADIVAFYHVLTMIARARKKAEIDAQYEQQLKLY